MRRIALVALMIVGLAAVANAAPAWWDDADFETRLTGTVENIGGQGEAEGTITQTLENDPNLGMYKEVFVEFDWWRVNDPDDSASFDQDVKMNWDGHPAQVSLNLVDSGPLGPGGFWADYDYTIIPQPANETFYFRFTGLLAGDILGYEYDIRTKCFGDGIVPEPAGLGFVGMALLALRRRRS
ncbi:MAG: PEP-CTERM sorting domain-containing protein [Planctomycetota bacterium]